MENFYLAFAILLLVIAVIIYPTLKNGVQK